MKLFSCMYFCPFLFILQETSGNAFVAVVSKDGSNDSLLAVQLGVASFNDVGEQEQTLKPGHREFFTSIESRYVFQFG